MAKAAGEKKTIEQSFSRVEEIIRQLENPDTGLGDAMELYKEGVLLLEESRKTLEGVEQELQVLNPNSIKDPE